MPWHLKLSFQLMDTKEHPSEQGTIEEWWKSPSMYKVVFSSPSYSSTEIQTGDGLYRTGNTFSPPYLLDLVREQIVHPLTEEELRAGTPRLEKRDFGKVPLDCIMIEQPIKTFGLPPLGLFPTYCMDRDKDVLRASYNFGNQTVLRNHMAVFQKRVVPMNLIVQLEDKAAITAQVEDLRGFALQESDFATTDLERADNATDVSGSVMQGHIVSQERPVYPDRAKHNHVSGTVRLGAIIGSDGKIRSLKFASIPDADLGIAAVAAVRHWRYQPYLLNGVPVDVQTEITVNFEIR
jgi:TonB family protein